MPHISVVSPVYMADKVLPELVDRISISVKQLSEDFEIILVEDGSTDQSWEVIEQLSEKCHFINGIKLSRNFGQHYAITAGLDHAKGDWVVVMDCDLQDRPEEIPNLYAEALKGYDVVFAKRVERKDNFVKKACSKLFSKILSYLTEAKFDESVANFGIYSRKLIDAVNSLLESIRVFPVMVWWVGFKSSQINVKHGKRKTGKSNYNLKMAMKLALDVILAYSDKPIMLLIKTVGVISILAFIYAIVILIIWLNGMITVTGYTSLIISIWFLSGIIISTLGVIGLYVGKTFEGVKNRPIYVIEKTTND